MKKLIVLMVIIIAGVVLFTKPEKTPEKQIEQLTGRYIEYSKDSFDSSKDKRRVLYFWAAWCPTCAVAHPEFVREANRIPEDVILYKTNYDTETELKKKYAITYQHTFVQVDENENEITKWNGGGIEEFLTNIK